jgi:hypothetical protein
LCSIPSILFICFRPSWGMRASGSAKAIQAAPGKFDVPDRDQAHRQ